LSQDFAGASNVRRLS
jgi:putative transposase